MKGFLSGSVGHCEHNWKLWLFWQDGNHTTFHRALDKMWVTARNQTSSVRRGWQQWRPSPWKVDRLPGMTPVPTLHTKNVITVLNQHDWGLVFADHAEYRRRGQTPPSTLVGWSFVDVFSSGVGQKCILEFDWGTGLSVPGESHWSQDSRKMNNCRKNCRESSAPIWECLICPLLSDCTKRCFQSPLKNLTHCSLSPASKIIRLTSSVSEEVALVPGNKWIGTDTVAITHVPTLCRTLTWHCEQ